MPLQKAHLTIPLGGSLQTQVDDKQLPIGGMLELQNVRPGRVGELVPRLDTTALGTGLMETANSLRTPWALGTLKDALVSLAGVGNNPACVYSPTANQWGTDAAAGAITTQQRGPIYSTVQRVSGEGQMPDIAYSGGLYFLAYYATNAAGTIDVHEQVIDAATGTKLADFVVNDGLTTMAVMVRIVNGYAVFIRYSSANQIAFDAWLLSNLDAGPTTTFFATGGFVLGGQWTSAANTATAVSVVYQNLAGNLTGVDFAPATAVTTAWVLHNAGGAVIVGGAVDWLQDFGGNGTKSLVTYTSGAGVFVQLNVPTTGATRTAASTINVDVTANLPTIAIGHTTSAVLGTFVVMYSLGTGFAIRSFTGGALTFSVNVLEATLRSQSFTDGGDYYVLTETVNTSQEARFVMRVPTALNPAIVARAQVNGSFVGALSHPAQVVSPAAHTWVTPTTAVLRITANVAGHTPYVTGIELVKTVFDQPGSTSLGAPKEAIDSLFVPGGALRQFDGKNYCDAGFAQYPTQPTLVAGAGGGLTSSSTYSYRLVYARPDASGRIWRSAPSILKSVALGVGQNRVTLTCNTLPIADRSDLKIEIYRGGANDANTFQLVGTVSNSLTADTVNFVDNLSDAGQALGEFLYTNGGGVLQNDPIPGAMTIAVTPTRLLFVSADDPQVIWPSAPFVPGLGLRFSEVTKLQVRDQHGAVTGLASQPNGSVVVFKKDAVYLLTGDGPNAAGQGGYQLTMVASGLGTTNPRSIVETSLGTEFQSTSSKAGWWRIGLGGTPEYIGAPIERYIGSTVVGAVMIPTLSETRYYLATGGSLVHRFDRDMWMIDTGTAATCATAYGVGAAYGTAVPSVITDVAAITGRDAASAPFTITIMTPWIKLGDLRGYDRMYRLTGVGEIDTAETSSVLTVSLQVNMVPTNIVSQLTPFNMAAPKGTFPWQMRYSAKFEAARVVLTLNPADYDSPASIKHSAIVLEYGVKQGMRPIASGFRTT